MTDTRYWGGNGSEGPVQGRGYPPPGSLLGNDLKAADRILFRALESGVLSGEYL